MQRLRGGLVFKAHRLFVSLNSMLESNKEEEEMNLENEFGALRLPWNHKDDFRPHGLFAVTGNCYRVTAKREHLERF